MAPRDNVKVSEGDLENRMVDLPDITGLILSCKDFDNNDKPAETKIVIERDGFYEVIVINERKEFRVRTMDLKEYSVYLRNLLDSGEEYQEGTNFLLITRQCQKGESDDTQRPR